MTCYDVESLEGMLENAENNDAETHKLYNNLGLAHAAKRNFRASLKAHREEKQICKRLLEANPHDPTRHLDLAIAYRRCGDVIPKLTRLVDSRNSVITEREQIIRTAHTQHARGLEVARSAPVNMEIRPAIQLELQAASAALAQSSIALALHSQQRAHFVDAAKASARAAELANRLDIGHVGLSHGAKQSVLLGIATNHAIAFSGMGDKKRARNLLHAVAIRARQLDDHCNLVRALSNLSEEASEEGEWDLAEVFVREWIRHARRVEDNCDEADALRKLAIVLREIGDLHGAQTALKNAIRLPASTEGKAEAETFLTVIQHDIVEHDLARKQLKTLQREAEVCLERGEYVEEAKLRISAGNFAFTLRKSEIVIEILGRYFELVDDFGCNTVITGVEETSHNNAIANMGESYWKLINFEQAVHWATRELSVYDADLPGQAQAWCNLGVYLDDYGKKERALDALHHSIDIANKCGETDTMTRAKGNLQLVEQVVMREKELQSQKEQALQEQSRERRHSASNVEDVFTSKPSQRDALHSSGSSSRRKRASAEVRRNEEVEEGMHGDDFGEKSVIIDSSQPLKKAKMDELCKHDRGTDSSYDMKRTCASTKQSMPGDRYRGEHALTSRSHDAPTEDFNSRGMNIIVDLAAEYRSICGRKQRNGAQPRPMIVNALRTVSSALLSREAREQHSMAAVRLNLSGLLVDSDDLAIVCETLSIISAEHDVFLDLSMNPLINASAYECINSRKYSSPVVLHSVKQLDLSCAGVSAETIRKLADSLNEQGALANISSINLSKNALGRHGRVTATAVSRMLCCPSRLRSMDLSLNMLSSSFLPDLMERLENTDGRDSLSASVMQNINLSLNNRRGPSGLLETFNTRDMIRHFSQLFKVLSALESVDVRACGASLDMRRSLRQLSNSFTVSSRTILTVYDANLDEDGD